MHSSTLDYRPSTAMPPPSVCRTLRLWCYTWPPRKSRPRWRGQHLYVDYMRLDYWEMEGSRGPPKIAITVVRATDDVGLPLSWGASFVWSNGLRSSLSWLVECMLRTLSGIENVTRCQEGRNRKLIRRRLFFPPHFSNDWSASSKQADIYILKANVVTACTKKVCMS